MAITALLIAFSLIIFSLWCKWNNGKILKMKDIPGPFIIPFFGSVFFAKFTNNTDIISRIENLSRTYGPHTKLFIGNNPLLFITDPTDNRTFLNLPKNTHKPEIIYRDFQVALGNGLLTGNGNKWQNHRKVLSKTFNAMRINKSIDILQKGAEELVISLSRCKTSGIDIELVIFQSLLTTSAEIFLGYDINDPEKWSEFAEVTKRLSEILGLKTVNPLLKIDFLFNLTPLGKQFRVLLLEAQKFIDEIIERGRLESRIAGHRTHSSAVVDILLNTDCNEQDLHDEILTFAVVSTDTSTMTITIALVLIALHPAIQDTLLEEILHVLGPTGKVDTDNVQHLKYLEMVVLETLRLFPTVPLYARQYPDDIQLSKFTVPANTAVVTNVFSMHRDEKHWPDPLTFKPERFSAENSANKNSNAFMPFAAGPRICPGAKYATLQMMTVLANIIRRYKVSTEYKSVEDIKIAYALTLGLANGTKCTLEERKLV